MKLVLNRNIQVWLLAGAPSNLKPRALVEGKLLEYEPEKFLVVKDDEQTDQIIPWHAIQRISQSS